MVLGDVEETITIVDVNEETLEEVIRVKNRIKQYRLDNNTFLNRQ